MQGKLYLIPAPISESTSEKTLPAYNLKIINSIRFFIVENVRTARRFLSEIKILTPIDELIFYTLNKHSQAEEIPSFLNPIEKGSHIGLLSEAGTPCIADPGAVIVEMAHKKNIEVIPLTGPSSVILALMASGLNGQNFTFLGYLPINKADKIKTIKQIEKKSAINKQTQIFIEAPYRNNQLFEDLVQHCQPSTLLCIATAITSDNEYIKTKPIYEWKKVKIDLNKKPVIFLLQHVSGLKRT